MSCFTWNLEGSRKVVAGLIFLQLACLWFNLSSSGPWGFLFQSDGSSAGPWEKYDFRKLFERYTEKIAFFKQPQEQEITFEKTNFRVPKILTLKTRLTAIRSLALKPRLAQWPIHHHCPTTECSSFCSTKIGSAFLLVKVHNYKSSPHEEDMLHNRFLLLLICWFLERTK